MKAINKKCRSDKNVSILTYNFVSLPIITKDISKRLTQLIKEITVIQPDIICFQEIWWGRIRKVLKRSLEPLGYTFFIPKSRFLINGLVTCAKGDIQPIETKRLKPLFNGINILLIEGLGFKGYTLARISLPQKQSIYVFNVHLSANWGDKFEKTSRYSKVQVKSLKEIEKKINSLKDKLVIAAGDFNIQTDFFYYNEYLYKSGLKAIVSESYKTTLPHLFRFKFVSKTKRTNHIFIKNFPNKSTNVRVVWDKAVGNVSQLSDHAGILAKIMV